MRYLALLLMCSCATLSDATDTAETVLDHTDATLFGLITAYSHSCPLGADTSDFCKAYAQRVNAAIDARNALVGY